MKLSFQYINDQQKLGYIDISLKENARNLSIVWKSQFFLLILSFKKHFISCEKLSVI